MGEGLQFPRADLAYHNSLVEEGRQLEEHFETHKQHVEGCDPQELLEEWDEETQDFNRARMLADLDLDSDLDHDPDWSRLEWGKIYQDGFFGEKMLRSGDWKEPRFGKSKNKLPEGYRFSDEQDVNHRGGLPNFNFIKAQKTPTLKENRHLRYMRRFSKLNRENPSVRQVGQRDSWWDDGGRRGRNELPPLHPRVEQALGAMFEDMARTRDFRFEDEY